MKAQITALEQVAATYAKSILHSIQQEYPNQMQHMMTGPDDRPTPREAHPAFYGCFDWHSAVHGHWLLARILDKSPAAIRRGLYTLKKIEAMPFEESMSFTESQIALFTLTEDAKEGQAAFQQKRKPEWKGQ